jgi:telomerase protein component 1
LRIACEELRVGVIFEDLTAKLRTMAANLPGLINGVLERLEQDHGTLLVQLVLQFFALSRGGLPFHDVRNLLHLSATRKLMGFELPSPIAISSLFLSLDPFLQTLGDGIGTKRFYHPEFTAAVLKKYFSRAVQSKNEPAMHTVLVDFYSSLADPKHDGSYLGREARAYENIVHHLSHSGQWVLVAKTLCNLNFIRGKCAVGLGLELVRDYLGERSESKAFEREQRKLLSQENVIEYASFVMRNMHILSRKPALTWQQALNEPSSSLPSRDVQALVDRGLCIVLHKKCCLRLFLLINKI